MIKYLGSKRTLVPAIIEVIQGLGGVRSIIDLFSGTSRVGHGLKSAGFQVFANDHNAYAATLARCYVQADRDVLESEAAPYIEALNALEGRAGYFTETFCERSRFFHPKNGARVDAMREQIAQWQLSEELEAVLLVSLMEAADRVDSTCGVQMAYLKEWAARAHQDIALRLPQLVACPEAGRCEAHQLDALEAAGRLSADVAYLDPPYNQHSYLGNYHVWESLVLWDKPEVYGVACKRVDVKERKSDFNAKRRASSALEAVISALDATHLIVSFNNEGYIPRDEMETMLASRGEVLVIEKDFKRYVGAQIGIYNPAGDKVGRISHLRNKEFLYVVSEDLDALKRLRATAPS